MKNSYIDSLKSIESLEKQINTLIKLYKDLQQQNYELHNRNNYLQKDYIKLKNKNKQASKELEELIKSLK